MSKIIFSSHDLPATLSSGARARVWAETFMAGGYNGEAIVTAPANNFFGHVELMAPAGTMVARSSATNLILNRHVNHIQRDMDDRMMLFFNNGQSDMRTVQLGREAVIGHGEGVLITQENPQSLDGSNCDRAGQVICVILPHEATGGWSGTPQDLVSRKQDYGHKSYRLLRAYSHLLADEADSLTTDAALSITRIIATLTASWLGIAQRETPSQGQAVNAGRLAAMRRSLRRQYHRPDLHLRDIAGPLGLSERMVQHILTQSGESFSGLLSAVRCDKARQMLVDPACDHYTIEQIAYLCGFIDYTVFFRAMRRHVGATPRDVRQGRGATS